VTKVLARGKTEVMIRGMPLFCPSALLPTPLPLQPATLLPIRLLEKGLRLLVLSFCRRARRRKGLATFVAHVCFCSCLASLNIFLRSQGYGSRK